VVAAAVAVAQPRRGVVHLLQRRRRCHRRHVYRRRAGRASRRRGHAVVSAQALPQRVVIYGPGSAPVLLHLSRARRHHGAAADR
jgi:hypothetical protein